MTLEYIIGVSQRFNYFEPVYSVSYRGLPTRKHLQQTVENTAVVIIVVDVEIGVVVVVVGKVPPVSRVQRECIIEHKLFSVPKQICSFRSETPDLSGFKFRAN